MKKMREFLKKALISVTIMVIPHDSLRPLNLKIPMVGLIVTILFALIGGGYTLSLAVSGLKYKAQHGAMVEKIKFYSGQFYQWDSTVAGLKMVESQFRRLFSLQSKEEVLENVDTAPIGSLEIPNLIAELKKTIETVDGIKEYLRVQKDIYVATPKGFPVEGELTSNYGRRADPFSGKTVFHTGIDISCDTKSSVRATADGVVSHSGWVEGSGYVVILEHGCGFSTVYAHNSTNNIKVGQKVKRGDIIALSGSTGKSTGPHVHYEVWKDGKTVNAQEYVSGRS